MLSLGARGLGDTPRFVGDQGDELSRRLIKFIESEEVGSSLHPRIRSSKVSA
jgi:hypothetical protein